MYQGSIKREHERATCFGTLLQNELNSVVKYFESYF